VGPARRFKQNVQTMDSKDPALNTPSQPASQPAWAQSTQFAPTSQGPGLVVGRAPAPSPFDVCHVGVVLRVVLGVQAVVALGVAHAAGSPLQALQAWSQSTLITLPPSLLWLVLACAAKGWLRAQRDWKQAVVAVGLGAWCGLLGAGLDQVLNAWLTGATLSFGWAWMPPVLTGAAMAGVGLTWLRQRAHSELPAHASARLAELQARIRPHFLFNTLNTAIALVQVDPQRAESVLEDLAELFRQALVAPHVVTTLNDEVDLAKRYLSIEQLRFGERVQVRWELDADAGRAEVPALVLQPLVENAVRHGVEVSADGGWIVVRTKVQAGRAVLMVSNSVPVQAQAGGLPGHGMALRNVRQRLKLMHDVEADFDAGLQPPAAPGQPAVYMVKVAVPLPRGTAVEART
jgi:two-component system sensor histidine kinase AlgZ